MTDPTTPPAAGDVPVPEPFPVPADPEPASGNPADDADEDGGDEDEDVPGPLDLYWLLYRLAGRVPDDGLAIMRTCIADGEFEEAVDLLATALNTGRLPLTEEEGLLARAALERVGEDPGLVDLSRQLEELPDPPYTFTGVPGEPDEVDLAVVEAAAPVGGVRGLWRVQRTSSRATVKIRLVEASDGADLLEMAAEMQHVIAEAGEVPPRIEVITPDAELPPYHREAMAAAELVWVAPDETDPELVRVFDGADPETGPYFRPDHPKLTGPDRDRALRYLNAGETVLASFGYMDDVVDPAALDAVPVSFRSDGRWIWTDTVAYYLERHDLAPDPGLLEHVLAATEPPPRLSWVQRHRAMQVLTAPDEEPAWQPT
ncbi:MAG TPA: hypothetical protein VF109_01330 [Mycobacteriales bacterium]